MYPASSILDLHVGIWYRVLDSEPVACIAAPRERSFIVVEDHGLELGGTGRFCVYIVGKRSLSTHEALRLLARALGVKASLLKALGLKDTEATTVQAVCTPCPQEPPRYIVLDNLWARLAGRLEACPRPGRLRGNRFTIVLETGDTGGLLGALDVLRGRRLPAYYGYQRFGTRRPNTHTVGILLLRGEVDAALYEAVAAAYPDESSVITRCRLSMWRDGGCPRGMYEAWMAESAGDPLEAIRRIPRSIMEVFIGAVQAYIFNLYLSLRTRYGYDLGEKLRGERQEDSGRPLALVPGIGYRIGVDGEARKLLMEAIELAGLTPRGARRAAKLCATAKAILEASLHGSTRAESAGPQQQPHSRIILAREGHVCNYTVKGACKSP
ncbi:tRNA pseudouridine(13) synthase TruD [Hyperthermus butylicus]|uniref:tRNA pseudouridine(13) synthase TruD n=1 Tax=Hyperthermus butylicus TaxID=54248 RepID=UPI00064EE8B0|nr:tRNA pseudouridine(13) synthase TruD [Hyperthermus butylicus]